MLLDIQTLRVRVLQRLGMNSDRERRCGRGFESPVVQSRASVVSVWVRDVLVVSLQLTNEICANEKKPYLCPVLSVSR